MNWIPDGTDAVKADLGNGRVARIGLKGRSYVARITGGDPGGGACGGFASLDEAKAYFDPSHKPGAPASPVAPAPAPVARKPGAAVDVAGEFAARVAAQGTKA